MSVTNKENVFLSGVIYYRNNLESTIQFIRTVSEVFEQHFSNYEIIIVDDASKADIESSLLDLNTHITGNITIVRMSYPQGVQAAINAGVDMAIGDFVFEFEQAIEDFSPSLIIDVFRKELEGFDVVSVTPSRGGSLSSKLFYRVFNKGARMQYPLASERFRLVSRRAINRIEAMADSIVYRKAFFKNSGLKCANIEYIPTSRIKGSSLPEERGRLATDSLILFTDTAYSLSLFMTITMMAVALFSGGYTLLIFILGKPTEGWTTMMLLMSLAFFGVFAILTIVVKYLSVILDLSFSKSRYLVEGIRKLNKE
ncbi:MAG: glycosyltransferase [Oscillospiraceae bacterium]|nr:glycosyltransferase [Oscillospiraceae bacterium]